MVVVRGTAKDFGKQDVLAKPTEQAMFWDESGVAQKWGLDEKRRRVFGGEEEEEKAPVGIG